ncbi:FMN-binding negative transcriptional regulator [Caulobacter sp. KR2-114]|uniref:FMN-binding negative transcriptional regulator n=1 Tax=Caulobacter sp. KR2-114 TaxID=3400912 RepID=UPI003C0DAFAC
MHPAPTFALRDPQPLLDFVAHRGFAVLAAQGPEGPVTAHAAVIVTSGVLRFHLSAANRMVAALAERPRLLAVVTGPDAYVSPDWYAAEDQVPTWNYVAVEIEGEARALDRAGARTLLDDLSAHFEAKLAPKPPWTTAKMTPAKLEALLGGIVAYEAPIARLEGTWKLSQNKPGEVSRVAAALEVLPDAGAQGVARLMRGI